MKEMIRPQFTILTAAYQSGQYMKEWSKSIFRQGYRPLNVVFVDDCSTDDTQQRLSQVSRDFSKFDVNFSVIRNSKRLFCGSSYRVAMEHAMGSNFYGVVDSDDALEKDAVEYVVDLYGRNPGIGWIYTQFDIYTPNMKFRRKGFCEVPKNCITLLETGDKKKRHTYSHWRTFSDRIGQHDTIFPEGLRCSVDKYMGYRLEELGPGGFVDHVCYRYRQPVAGKKCISLTEPTRAVWSRVVKDASHRRAKEKLKPYPIIKLKS